MKTLALLVALLAQDDPAKKLEELTEQLKDGPTAAKYLARGRLYAGLGRYENGLQDADEAVRLDPVSDDIWVLRSRCLASTGKLDDAIRDACRAMELNPRNPWSALHRARAYALKGSVDEAKRDVVFALQIDFALKAASDLALKGRDPEAPPPRTPTAQERIAAALKKLDSIEDDLAAVGEAGIPALKDLARAKPDLEKLVDRVLAKIAALRKRVEELAPGLAADDPAARDAASAAIRKLGPGAVPTLRRLAASAEGESKARLQQLVEALENPQ